MIWSKHRGAAGATLMRTLQAQPSWKNLRLVGVLKDRVSQVREEVGYSAVVQDVVMHIKQGKQTVEKQ